MQVSGFGYSALGDTVPESVLDAKWPHAPGWVPMAANIMICLHMVAAVQIYAQVIPNEHADKPPARRPKGSARGGPSGTPLEEWDGGPSLASHALHPGSLPPRAALPPSRPGGPQVLFTTVELWLSRPLSHCGLSLVVSDLEAAARPRARRLAAASLRVGVRCALIGVCMMLAVLVPSFSAVIGLIGALLFWPAGGWLAQG